MSHWSIIVAVFTSLTFGHHLRNCTAVGDSTTTQTAQVGNEFDSPPSPMRPPFHKQAPMAVCWDGTPTTASGAALQERILRGGGLGAGGVSDGVAHGQADEPHGDGGAHHQDGCQGDPEEGPGRASRGTQTPSATSATGLGGHSQRR